MGDTQAVKLDPERDAAPDPFMRGAADSAWAATHGLIGQSLEMQRVFDLVARVRDAPTPLLIQGETGTGKELVARAIHFGSTIRHRPFLAQNCAALADGLLESELFGHRRGAFTGAVEHRTGLFEVAAGGTILLDEIGEASLGLQSKLLRVLQDGEIRPLGEERSRRVAVRVIAATNRDLAAEVAAGRFRADLFFRLSVVPISLPALRDRRADIPLLAQHFIAKHAARLTRRVGGVTAAGLRWLCAREFPGNVRELENVIERALLLCRDGEPLTEDVLAADIRRREMPSTLPGESLASQVARFERECIAATLHATSWNKSAAARRLGLTYHGLLAKMRRLGCA